MADQTKPNSFQKFILDPKSSVKTYLTESLTSEKDHHENNPNKQSSQQSSQQGNWQQNGSNNGNNQGQQSPQAQTNWNQLEGNNRQNYPGANLNPPSSAFIQQTGPQRPTSSASNRPQYQQQSYVPEPPASQQYSVQSNNFDFPQRPHPQEPSIYHSPPPTNAGFSPPPLAPTPVHPQHQHPPAFAQQEKLYPAPPSSYAQQEKPYVAPTAFYPVEPTPPQYPQTASFINTPAVSTELSNPSMAGLAPPPAEIQNVATPAPRLYHRMVVDFETLKAIFYAAKIQPKHNDLIPVASKLKSMSREIWNLRYTRSSEFSFPEAAHEQIITIWKAEFEQWSDILEDLYDPVLVKKQAITDAENDFPKLAGLTLATAPAPVKKVASVATPAAAAATPAKAPVKKVVAKAVDGEAAPVVKKKVVVKKVVAAE